MLRITIALTTIIAKFEQKIKKVILENLTCINTVVFPDIEELCNKRNILIYISM